MIRDLRRRWRSPWLIYGGGGLLGFLAVALVVLKWAPDWFAETKGLDAKGRLDARQGIRTTSLALLAGTFGAITAIYTARTFALNRAGQLTDRITRAIEQVGHKEVQVRIGGIYALERIARESKEDHPQVVDVLIAYLREHAPKAAADRPSPDTPRPTPGVRAVLTVLGRRTRTHEEGAKSALDLSSLVLVGANLSGANLSGANLSGTDLSGADLGGADVSGANLMATNLSAANLGGANLHGARYDHRTEWPEGFVAVATGAQLEDGH